MLQLGSRKRTPVLVGPGWGFHVRWGAGSLVDRLRVSVGWGLSGSGFRLQGLGLREPLTQAGLGFRVCELGLCWAIMEQE